MYLKSLELHGFKSFPEKTKIEFDSGSTVIVGPNGSGKSNITDAMRWVLGELSTKNIRGAKMEDVIFVGADGYRQMNFAEVSVTFDDSAKPKRLNSEYDEITVTRRYYRSGDSEYFINRKNVRLRDIYELFMNTGVGRDGYSIIGQGKIAEIISKKSEERRSIFEETAGISKYRYRKNESERKLQETEANMLRIFDILSELETRIGPMERSAQKARKYIELFEKKKEADVSLWLYDMVKKKEEIAKLESDLEISRHELDMADDTLSRLEGQNERLFEESQKNNKDRTDVFEEIKALKDTIHDLEKEYQLLENTIAHEKRTIESEKLLADKDRESADAERSRLSEIEELSAKALAEVERIEGEISSQTTLENETGNKLDELKKSVDDLLVEIRSHEENKNSLEVRLNVIRSIISENTERSKSLDCDIAKYQAELDEKKASLASLRQTIEEYDDSIKNLNDERLSSDRKINNKSDEVELAKSELSQLGAQKSALDSRIGALSNMLEHFDGYNQSVKFVMTKANSGALKGIHKPVSYLLQVPDEYTVAVETSLGSALQGIVTEDERSAKDAIRALKKENAGRATFYPISSVKKRGVSRDLEKIAAESGYIGTADELVSCDGMYRGVISHLLGNVAVFENIELASDAAKKVGYTVKIVTLDGQQINPGGSYTGGSARRDSGMITRQNIIEKLKAESNEISGKIEAATQKLSKASKELEALKNAGNDIEEKLGMIEALKGSEALEAEELSARCDVIEGLIVQLKADAEGLAEKEKTGEIDYDNLKAEIESEENEIKRLTDERFGADSDAHDAEKELDAISAELGRLAISLAESRKDVEAYENSALEIRSRIDAFENSAKEHDTKVETTLASIARSEETIKEKKAEAEEKRKVLAESEGKHEQLEENAIEFEKKINDISRETREISSKRDIVFEAHTRGTNKLQNLQDEVEKTAVRIYDEYELTHADALKLNYPEVTKETRGEVSKNLGETKNAIRALGSVNVDAIREYAELKERYDTMKAQYDDLTASKNELNELINSISSEMEVIFKEAFDKINKNFGEVFKELFGGGHAELTLTDPSNVLSSGIEIAAAPPGKIIKNLSLLSGGEQAFVAIALMFALIKVNPSPFCIFDEIEAALDEVNVARVANYVSRFSKDIQIIMITHRRGTMEIADTLYGVTMPRHGISKVFVLDVSSVAKQKFAEENL